MRTLAAEALGTFLLVLLGTGAVVVNDVSGGALGHVGVALVFGLVVFVLINTFGDVSGAHLNPAVSIAFAAAGRFAWSRVSAYCVAQIVGAVGASAALGLAFDAHGTLGATVPAGGLVGRAFFVELFLAFVLMLVVLAVSDGARERGSVASTTIGAVIAFEALVGGPVSGASMNPARSLGPALVSGHTESAWLYVVAPILGALLAVPTCRLLRARGCCPNGGCAT